VHHNLRTDGYILLKLQASVPCADSNICKFSPYLLDAYTFCTISSVSQQKGWRGVKMGGKIWAACTSLL